MAKLRRKTPPLTRVEINSVPVDGMKVRELNQVLDFEPFRHVTRYRVTFVEPPPTASRAVLRRFYEFKALAEKYGLWQTRRDLNKKSKRNFKRDYGDFYEVEELQPTLDEIFQQGIRGFFSH